MHQKMTKKMILLFVLSCVASLLIGVALGYGIQAQGLMGAAVSNGSDDPDGLGASRPNYTDWRNFTCVSCGKETGNYYDYGVPLKCPLCGAENPK